MKIIVNNKTKYRTDDIRKLLKTCIKKDGVNIAFLKVDIEYQRGWTGGRAYYDGRWMMLGLKNPDSFINRIKRMKTRMNKEEGKAKKYWADAIEREREGEEKYKYSVSDPKRVAEVIFHELQHIKGLHHEDMLSDSNFDVSWVDENYPLRLKEEILKPERDLIKERYEKVLRHIKKKESIIRRYQKLLKRWKKKQRYYEKKLNV